MRDKDSKLLEERYESLFAGKIEEGEDTSLDAIQKKDDDKEKKEDKKDSDKEEKEEKKTDSDEPSKDSSDEEKEEHEESESEEEEEAEEGESDEDSEEGDSEKGGDAGIQSKVKQLQKQYNDLLVDAFEKYAAECIENALDGVESSFGENIQDILDQALQELKSKILGDLGVEDTCCAGGGMGGMGGMEIELGDKPDVKFGAPVGGVPTIEDEGPEDDEAEESEEDDEKSEVEEEAYVPSDAKAGKEMKKKGSDAKFLGAKASKKESGDKKETVKESVLAAKFYGFV